MELLRFEGHRAVYAVGDRSGNRCTPFYPVSLAGRRRMYSTKVKPQTVVTIEKRRAIQESVDILTTLDYYDN